VNGKVYIDNMNRKLKRFLLSLLTLCSVMVLKGQIVEFERLDISDGLSSSRVYCIDQDKYGFIWVGTVDGLNIYNGVEFKHFYADPRDFNTLPGNLIEKVVFIGDTAFVATSSGLCMMDVVTKKCTQIDLGANARVNTLHLEKESGVLWIGTASGLLKYNISTKDIREFNSTNSNISHQVIRSIYSDSDGALWIGTFNKLNKLTPNSTVFEHIALPEAYNQNINNKLILSIEPFEEDNDTLLWIGMQTGLVLYNRLEHNTVKIIDERFGLTNSVIKDIYSSSTGEMWLGTDFGLVNIHEGELKDIHFHDPYKKSSLVNSVVWDVFEDQSGTLWFGTDNGISIHSHSSDRFSFYPMVFNVAGVRSGYDIRSITEDRKGQLWMATQNGFILFKQDQNTIQSYNSGVPLFRDVNNIFEDSQGRIWVATNGGITLYNPYTGSLENFSATFKEGNGLRSNYIYGFVETSTGELHTNTSEGLHRIIYKEGSVSFTYIGNLDVIGNGKKYLWATDNSILTKINQETYETNVVFENPFKNQNLYFKSTLVDSSENQIWMGIDNGLILFDIDTEEYQFFEIQSDKKYPLINLLKDKEGNIWTSSFSEILMFSPKTNEFEIYPSGQGVSISRFFDKSCVECGNGDLVFGGQDGFLRFSPNNITKSDYNPPIRFTKLSIANNEISPSTRINNKIIINKEISFTDEVILDYVDGSFVIEFSSLHYGSRDGILYKYMLEGEDNAWHYIDNDVGRASYSRLMSGSYVLKVKGTNNDGVWNDNEAILKITIKPPVWASSFMILIYAIVFVLLIGFLFYYYRNRVKWRNQMQLIRLEKEHSETEAKNRQKFFTNVAHEFRTPLNLIVGPLDKLVNNKSIDKEGKTLINIFERNTRRLLWLNNQFLDLRKVENKTIQMNVSEFEIINFLQDVFFLFNEESERHNIKYVFNKDVDSIMVEMDLRKVETIVFNLLSNAFKYTADDGEIVLDIKMEEKDKREIILISVKDTGAGISEEEQSKIFDRFYQAEDSKNKNRGLGIGLNMVKEYVTMHNGVINLTSQVGKGSEFIVSLPVAGHQALEGESSIAVELRPVLKSKPVEGTIYTSAKLTSHSNHILLVEDDKELADFLQISLSKRYNVAIVSNGAEALKYISTTKPDLVISDINMPQMDGVELTKRLKNNPKTSHIPLLILSGQSEKESQMKALKEGANAYLLKPVEIELLELRIENFLRRGEQLAELYKVEELSKPSDIKVSSKNDKILEKVVLCIEKHISEPDLTIDTVVDECGFSHTFLYRAIKKMTGQTLNELIRTVRLKRAEQLLRSRQLSVAEVMDETGFSNHSYFAKCFKKIYNKTPKEYMQDS
jgi:signal transduction histidine kinase/ligand-binding sensor domain-containing protein/AraC-like DNA-binding protein